MTAGRITQPLCLNCKHPRPFHGDGGPCKALGCSDCQGYVSPLSVSNGKPSPGQVWEDNDPRRKGRTVRIDAIEKADVPNHEDVAVVTILTTTAPRHTGSGVGAVKRIKVSRFRPTASGYRLVHS